jgi:RNA polymerase sigma factor (TIGR02999 family)
MRIGERDQLLSDVYDELRAAASRMLRRDAPLLTLQPTELANEAAIRIIHLDRMAWEDRRHFFATSATIMRQAMMDAIRRRKRSKRTAPTIYFKGDAENAGVEVEALNTALTKLTTISPDLAQIVEMRFFVGLRSDEIALVLDCSESTIKRRWQTARLWLASELAQT